MVATYDIERSFDWNFDNGPVYEGEFLDVPKTPQKDFLGLKVNSRIGIPAGLLLNSRWIEFYGKMGFDILTYKTVRNQYRSCYDLPNWVFIDRDDQIDPHILDEAQKLALLDPADHLAATSSVSFGMPSKAPIDWMPDVAKARQSLKSGQVLIVSVVASSKAGSTEQSMVDEFGELAAMAREAGAQIVEANLSCPNVHKSEGEIFLDAELSGKIAAAMQKGANGIPVLLKLGHFADKALISDVLQAVDGKASAVVMVNGISRRVVKNDGSAAFGKGREMSGILGRGIHAFSLDNVKSALEIVKKDQLSLKIVAVGGVSREQDAKGFFDAGAAAVMLGSAPMFDPTLAIQFKKSHPEW